MIRVDAELNWFSNIRGARLGSVVEEKALFSSELFKSDRDERP